MANGGLVVLMLAGYVNVAGTSSYLETDQIIAFCPLMTYKGVGQNFYDIKTSVVKSTPVETATECSLACFQDFSCKGFTFFQRTSNCTLHYSFPVSLNVQSYGPSTDLKPISFMNEGFSLYPYRHPYQCLIPFTFFGRLYNTCAPIITGFSRCNFQVCPVQTETKVEFRRCFVPENMTKTTTSFELSTCLENQKEIFQINAGKTWILIQHRKGHLALNWTDFKNGFGSPPLDYWIGNDWLYWMTNNLCAGSAGSIGSDYRLRIEMFDPKGGWYSAEYKYFKVGSERENYRLNLTGYDEAVSDVADGFGLADQPSTSKTRPPWTVWNCTLPCKVLDFATNDKRPVSTCTSIAVGWWYNSSQLNCQASLFNGVMNSQRSFWPNRYGQSPQPIFPMETKMFIAKA